MVPHKIKVLVSVLALVLTLVTGLMALEGPRAFPEFIGVDALTEALRAMGDLEAIGADKDMALERVRRLNQLSSLWRERDKKRSEAFNAEALALSEQLGDGQGLVEARLQKAYGLIGDGFYGEGILLLDEIYPSLAQEASTWLLVGQEPVDEALESVEPLISNPNPGYRFEDGYFIDRDLHWAVIVGQFKNAYGLTWSHLGDQARAQKAFEEALAIYRQVRYPRGVAQTLHNLSVIYSDLGGQDKAATYDIMALRLFEALGYADEVADVLSNLASISQRIGDQAGALTYLNQAMAVYTELGDLRGQGIIEGRIGGYFVEIQLYEEAASSYQTALKHFQELGDLEAMADTYLRLGAMAEAKSTYEDALSHYAQARDLYFDWAQVLEDQGIDTAIKPREGLVVAANNRGSVYYKLGLYGDALAAHQEAYLQAQNLSYREGLSASLYNLSQDYLALGDHPVANEYLQLYIALRDYVQEETVAEKTKQQQVLYETEKKERQLVVEEAAKLEAQAQRRRWAAIAIGAGIAMSIIAILLVLVYRERSKSEKLLLNILPKKVAQALKRTGKSPNERFEAVTVYFSDIVNFTTASSTMDPEKLIGELNDLFTLFDGIMEAHGCERIKTIGDAYLAVCGMPTPREDHAHRMLMAATEIREALRDRNAASEHQWEIRIGLHSGKVVGGIVGVKKYIYDIFGDTINTASRMESNSEPMAINLSQATYQILEAQAEFRFTERAPIAVKGKGEMKMYFAERAGRT